MKRIQRQWRTMRETRSMTKRKEDAMLATATQSEGEGPTSTRQGQAYPTMAASQPDRHPARPEYTHLSVFINDFTDSDNEASAEVWAWTLHMNPHIKGIYIAEPRHVHLGYFMNGQDVGRCFGIVSHLIPQMRPDTTVIGGRMTEDILKIARWGEYRPSKNEKGKVVRELIPGSERDLHEDERSLLKRCIKPANGTQEDAIKHARLVTLDYLSTMTARCQRPFDVYLDEDCIRPDGPLESPINLKTHYHDELVARSQGELEEFQKIESEYPDQNNVQPEKQISLRAWYEKAYTRKLKAFPNGVDPVKPLVMEDLQDEIKKYAEVTFFGGASLTVLHRILDADDTLPEGEEKLGKKINYYQQGGTTDSTKNILGNPYNFALNVKAAKFVFKYRDRLKKFVVIPTDTTKKLEFTMESLWSLSAPVGLRSLAFHGKIDPWALISDREKAGEQPATDHDFLKWRLEGGLAKPEYQADKYKKAVMADLTAFLISFTDAFTPYAYETGLAELEDSYQMVLKDDPTLINQADQPSPITSLMLKDTVDETPMLVTSMVNDTTIADDENPFLTRTGAEKDLKSMTLHIYGALKTFRIS